jgi:hypothetical protein
MRKTLLLLTMLLAVAVAAPVLAASPSKGSVTISVSRPVVVYGGSVMLSGKVSSHQAGASVSVGAEPFGASTFTDLDTVTTKAGGSWSYSAKPLIQTTYQARWNTAISRNVTVKVRPRITLTLKSRTSKSGTFDVKVSAERSFAGKYVLVQRLSPTGTTTLKHVVLDAGSSGTFTVRLPKQRARLRVVMPTSQTAPGYVVGYSNVWRSA